MEKMTRQGIRDLNTLRGSNPRKPRPLPMGIMRDLCTHRKIVMVPNALGYAFAKCRECGAAVDTQDSW
jgi:hypothetical protein